MDEGNVDKKPTCNDGNYDYDPAGTLKCNKGETTYQLRYYNKIIPPSLN